MCLIIAPAAAKGRSVSSSAILAGLLHMTSA